MWTVRYTYQRNLSLLLETILMSLEGENKMRTPTLAFVLAVSVSIAPLQSILAEEPQIGGTKQNSQPATSQSPSPATPQPPAETPKSPPSNQFVVQAGTPIKL